MNAPDKTALAVTYADVASAAERLAGHAHRTPVMTSRTVDERTGAQVFFKCENFQRMGAFKFRGAYNAMSQLAPDERKRGVLAYSSGNHAQAVAVAGKMLGVRVTIVMPADAPDVKLDATRGYGAEVVLYDKHKEVREEVAERTARERGLAMIPPFDHPHVIAGQGTAAKELIEDAAELPQPGHDRRRGAHPLAGAAHLSAGTALRARHGHGERRGTRPGDVLPVGADEDRGRADGRARRGGALRARTSGDRQTRRRDPLRRQRRSETARPVRVICAKALRVMAPHIDLQAKAFAECRFYQELKDFLAPARSLSCGSRYHIQYARSAALD